MVLLCDYGNKIYCFHDYIISTTEVIDRYNLDGPRDICRYIRPPYNRNRREWMDRAPALGHLHCVLYHTSITYY